MLYQYGTQAYQHKLAAIVELAQRWQERINDKEWPELDELLKTFAAFAEDYVRLLKQTPVEISRPKFALSRGVDKLLNEWNALSRACEQRFEDENVNAPGEGLPGNLRGAKRKLQKYCDRWNGTRVSAPYLKLSNPVVYFEKIYRLARSVYAPHSPVISIPLTDYDPGYTFSDHEDDELRWPALAHEFGHHIYWNALDFQDAEAMRAAMRDSVVEAIISTNSGEKTKGLQRIRQSTQIVGRASLWSQWLDEIFADICGTLLDGPIYALTAQDVAAERAQKVDDLKVGDFEHPAPYLRPFITLRVLRVMAQESPTETFRDTLDNTHGLIAQLEKRWREFCGQLETQHYPNTALTLQELENDIPAVVDTILTGRYWPGTKKNLLERLEIQDRSKPFHIENLPPLPLTVEPIVPQVSHRPEIDSEGSVALKKILKNIMTRVSNVELNDTQKPGVEWLSILSLDLSDTDYYHVHDCTDDHYHGWFFFLEKSHAHPQDGSTYFDC
jgi:hypothetical protein